MRFFLGLARNLVAVLVVVVGAGVSVAFAHPAAHVTDLATQGGIAAAPQAPIIEMPWGHEDRLVDLVSAEELTPSLVLFSLLIAFALGGLHALSPGHGKTIVAAYLVGSRGTAKHAVLLGVIVTVAHTAGVFLLGLVTLSLSNWIVPERLYPIIQLISGVAIATLGARMFATRLRDGLHRSSHEPPGGQSHHHSHGHKHDHGHVHGHLHRHGNAHDHGHSLGTPDGTLGLASLLTLGVSGGILPCPSALVVLLSAIALHRVAVGLVLIVAFSMGLAFVLSAVGILVIRAGSLLSRFDSASRVAHGIPAFSAVFVCVLGVGLVVGAIPAVHRALF